MAHVGNGVNTELHYEADLSRQDWQSMVLHGENIEMPKQKEFLPTQELGLRYLPRGLWE